MPRCWHCKAETPAAHWERVVENRTALYGPWEGWRMSGRFLIAPGKAGKILPARLLGLMWQERVSRKAVSRPGTLHTLPAVRLPQR